MTDGFPDAACLIRASEHPAARRLRAAWVVGAALPLAGCVSADAPAIPLFGAYFPSWLLAALIGIFGAILVRLVFIRAGIDDALPIRLPVYVCIAAAIGFAVSLLGFGR
ncbi:YtcA family lipoprotein [Ancylobacter sp.]|uniref:YtcA family lipoprotein n=1 Tax=Ancylobacter sp. TaxID=1872567 RepID=UPI003D11727A